MAWTLPETIVPERKSPRRNAEDYSCSNDIEGHLGITSLGITGLIGAGHELFGQGHTEDIVGAFTDRH